MFYFFVFIFSKFLSFYWVFQCSFMFLILPLKHLLFQLELSFSFGSALPAMLLLSTTFTVPCSCSVTVVQSRLWTFSACLSVSFVQLRMPSWKCASDVAVYLFIYFRIRVLHCYTVTLSLTHSLKVQVFDYPKNVSVLSFLFIFPSLFSSAYCQLIRFVQRTSEEVSHRSLSIPGWDKCHQHHTQTLSTIKRSWSVNPNETVG